jgi:hypothetical protein
MVNKFSTLFPNSHYSCAYQFVLQPGKCASSIGNVFSDAHDVMRIFRLPKGTMSIFENMLLPSHISRWACQTTNRPQLPTSRVFQLPDKRVSGRSRTHKIAHV